MKRLVGSHHDLALFGRNILFGPLARHGIVCLIPDVPRLATIFRGSAAFPGHDSSLTI